jgi:hypothetical protein
MMKSSAAPSASAPAVSAADMSVLKRDQNPSRRARRAAAITPPWRE